MNGEADMMVAYQGDNKEKYVLHFTDWEKHLTSNVNYSFEG